jgi:hypothetical protein
MGAFKLKVMVVPELLFFSQIVERVYIDFGYVSTQGLIRLIQTTFVISIQKNLKSA